MRYIYIGLFLATLFLQNACSPSENLTDVDYQLSDTLIQRILRYQDERNGLALKKILTHEDATYRYAATLALASVGDSTFIPDLAVLLEDPSRDVREIAAYALGQTYHKSAAPVLTKSFLADTEGFYDDLKSKRSILEAVGKCGDQKLLASLSSVKNYKPSDTLLQEGLALGIYRFSLRGITHENGTAKMAEMVCNTSYDDKSRRIAANYLGRSKNIDLEEYSECLQSTLLKEQDATVRMGLAVAVSKLPPASSLETIRSAFKKEKDYRVRCNLMRAMQKQDYPSVRDLVFSSLRDDESLHVKLEAARLLKVNGAGREGSYYRKFARDTVSDWQLKAELYEASLRNIPDYFTQLKGVVSQEIVFFYNKSSNPYEKGYLLKALAAYPRYFQYIIDKTFEEGAHPFVKSSGIEALIDIRKSKNIKATFGTSYYKHLKAINYGLFRAIGSKDVAMMGLAASVIREPKLNFKAVIDSLTFIEDALAALELPKETETYNELKKTLNFLNGVENEKMSPPDYNNPIDIERLKMVPEKAFAIIKTEKGNIKLELLTESAPATVLSFIAQISNKFYDGKTFHRVVPNFVAQAGCPRGDGWGGLDFSLRSESAPLYYDEEAYVGMASAGKDTEGTQFFITHSACPHLDGKYTIFAKVIEGMDVVHQLRVGDVMTNIELQ